MKTNTIIFTCVLLLNVACGKQSETNKCMTRAQVLVLCMAEGFQVRPEPQLAQFVQIDCERRYPNEDCYYKQGNYFPFDR